MNGTDLIKEKVKERYIKNFFLIKEHAPSLFKKINRKSQVEWRIIVNEKGINAVVNGQLLYPYDPVKIAQEQVERFKKEQTRYRMPYLPMLSGYKELGNRFLYELGQELRNILGDVPHIHLDFSFPFDGKNIPVLIVFGAGLGYHLIKLIRNFNIQHMIIIEPDPAFIHLSLYAIDWEELTGYFRKGKAKTLNFIIGDDPETIKNEITTIVSAFNPAFVTNIFFFEHFTSPVLEHLFDLFKHDYLLNPLLWGDIDTELRAVRHVIDIVKRRYPVYVGTKPLNAEDVPVFLIGSGPSLDTLADTVKKFQDKALIVSCGTAIGSLYKLGIKPDFHVVADPQEVNYDLLLKIDRDYLKQVNILGASFVHPDIFKLGKRKGVFSSHNSTVASALWDIEVVRIKNAVPTVTAAALSLFANKGFRKFYLFGIDLGTRDIKRHHSLYSEYYSPESPIYTPQESFDIEAEGNFGGKVYTKQVYLVNKRSMENTIKEYGLEVHNLSDGLKIEGAIPLEKERLRVGWSKDRFIRDIEKRVFLNYRASYNPQRIFKKLIDTNEDIGVLTSSFKPKFESVKTCNLPEFVVAISDLHLSSIFLGHSRGIYHNYPLFHVMLPTLVKLEMFTLTVMFGMSPDAGPEKFGGKALNIISRYLSTAREEFSSILKSKGVLPK